MIRKKMFYAVFAILMVFMMAATTIVRVEASTQEHNPNWYISYITPAINYWDEVDPQDFWFDDDAFELTRQVQFLEDLDYNLLSEWNVGIDLSATCGTSSYADAIQYFLVHGEAVFYRYYTTTLTLGIQIYCRIMWNDEHQHYHYSYYVFLNPNEDLILKAYDEDNCYSSGANFSIINDVDNDKFIVSVQVADVNYYEAFSNGHFYSTEYLESYFVHPAVEDKYSDCSGDVYDETIFVFS